MLQWDSDISFRKNHPFVDRGRIDMVHDKPFWDKSKLFNMEGLKTENNMEPNEQNKAL